MIVPDESDFHEQEARDLSSRCTRNSVLTASVPEHSLRERDWLMITAATRSARRGASGKNLGGEMPLLVMQDSLQREELSKLRTPPSLSFNCCGRGTIRAPRGEGSGSGKQRRPTFTRLNKYRAGGIRTRDLLNPIQAHYQAVLRPDVRPLSDAGLQLAKQSLPGARSSLTIISQIERSFDFVSG